MAKVWQPGRQGTGYQKLPIIKTERLDLYLLRYPKGSYLDEHKDPIAVESPDLESLAYPIRKHFRLNVVLRRAREGGEFVCDRTIFRTRRIALFRPDEVVHSVTRILRGTRYVLSMGIGI